MNTYKGGRFQAIERWMSANNLSVEKFALRVNVSRAAMYNLLRGIHDPGKYIIDAILRATGMTYEEAFREINSED